MAELVILIFIATLLSLSVAERIRRFNNLLAFQGLLLFLAALINLKHFDWANFLMVLAETLIFKTIVVPYIIYYIIRRHNIWRVENTRVKPYQALLTVTLIVAGSFLFAYSVHDGHLEIKYFTGAISAILAGLFLIAIHENILPHLFGYLIIENGVFLLSLAVGSHMPLVVNLGILLDIFTTALILGLLINKIGDKFKHVRAGALTELKD